MALLIAIKSSRNFVSGASGFLQNQPEIMSRKRKRIIIIKKQNNNRSFRRSRKALIIIKKQNNNRSFRPSRKALKKQNNNRSFRRSRKALITFFQNCKEDIYKYPCRKICLGLCLQCFIIKMIGVCKKGGLVL